MIFEIAINFLSMIFLVFVDFVGILFNIQIPLFLDSYVSIGDLILMLLYSGFILGILYLVFNNRGSN